MSEAENYRVIDFHIHIGLKEHWHTWVHDYQQAASSDLYEFYEDLIDPKKFASYLAGCGLVKAVILPDNNPLVTGTVPDEYVLEFIGSNGVLRLAVTEQQLENALTKKQQKSATSS